MSSATRHLIRLHQLPCAVTLAMEGRREYGVVVHHPEAVRDEMSHYAGIPMTEYWHHELHHLSRRGFLMRTKLTDLDLLAWTVKLLVESES